MIDGGPSGIYKKSLAPRLLEIRSQRGMKGQEPLPVELIMVSHIDDDHIHGLLDLMNELVQWPARKSHLPLSIQSLWHNSFARLLQQESPHVRRTFAAAFGLEQPAAAVHSDRRHRDVGKVLASVQQGVDLEDFAQQLGLKNSQSADGLILAAKPYTPIRIGKLKFTVLGPQQKELDVVREKYRKWLEKRAKVKARVATSSRPDTAPFNLSSIVVLVEAGGRKMLLTGDARGDKIIEGVKEAGLLKRGKTLHVDVLKAPHHGSDRNVTPAFFETITADHYVFSGDGQYGNPERSTLEMLAEAGRDRDFAVHLTYPVANIDRRRKKEYDLQHQGDPTQTPAWKAAQHSLAAFLKKTPEFAKKLRIVPQDGTPHVIDLGDEPLGF